jgi:radical SAM protein with 4Fe4S-binding SPASM domain
MFATAPWTAPTVTPMVPKSRFAMKMEIGMTSEKPNAPFKACWLTTNRTCNLRCKWCYATTTGFKKEDDLSWEDAKRAVAFCVNCRIRSIVLIGGEPTIYPYIHELIRLIKKSGMRCGVVSNGLVLADIETARKFIDDGVTTFSLSMKANNSTSYADVTGFDSFSLFLKAVSNLKTLGCRFSVSQVLTKENIPTFSSGIASARKAGATHFSFGFCYNFNCDGKGDFIANNNPYELADLFAKYYPEISSALAGCHYALAQGLPLCVWQPSIINKLVATHHINSICQLQKGNGILFDSRLNAIPCNAMFNLKYGQLGKDFTDLESYCLYLKSPYVSALFSQLRGIPDKACLKCKKSSQCGGGCVTNWTNYSFKELAETLKSQSRTSGQ